MKMGDERALGPKPSGALVHRRQVMQVDDVDVAEACALEHALHADACAFACSGPREQRRVRGALPILEGGRRDRPGQLILTALEALESRRVVRDLDVSPSKKLAACVCSPGKPSDPEASTTSQPVSTSARQRYRATCAEPPRG